MLKRNDECAETVYEPVSMDKAYETDEGLEVRIYATDGDGKFPVHGAVKKTSATGDARWISMKWSVDGRKSMYSTTKDSVAHLIREVPTRIPYDFHVGIVDDGRRAVVLRSITPDEFLSLAARGPLMNALKAAAAQNGGRVHVLHITGAFEA